MHARRSFVSGSNQGPRSRSDGPAGLAGAWAPRWESQPRQNWLAWLAGFAGWLGRHAPAPGAPLQRHNSQRSPQHGHHPSLPFPPQYPYARPRLFFWTLPLRAQSHTPPYTSASPSVSRTCAHGPDPTTHATPRHTLPHPHDFRLVHPLSSHLQGRQ